MIKIIDFLALLGFCAIIFWLSNQHWLPVPDLIEQQDKFHHFIAYFVMGVLAWRNFRHYLKTPLLLTIVSVVFCSLYGVSDEWHQSFVPGRSADVMDWLADTSGAAAAMTLLSRFFSYQKFD